MCRKNGGRRLAFILTYGHKKVEEIKRVMDRRVWVKGNRITDDSGHKV